MKEADLRGGETELFLHQRSRRPIESHALVTVLVSPYDATYKELEAESVDRARGSSR